jgi:hypothetical protein
MQTDDKDRDGIQKILGEDLEVESVVRVEDLLTEAVRYQVHRILTVLRSRQRRRQQHDPSRIL